MYETTISVPKSDEHLLQHIKAQTISAINEMDGIASDIADKHRCYYSVACSDTFRFQLKRLLLDSISETMALGYKNIYVRDYLNIDKGNFYQNVLINTMCVFDKAYDQQIIGKIVDADKPIYIDGYCNFRLDTLKRKWQEIAKLVCDNNYILNDNQLILEFLQYLLESVNYQVSELTVTMDSDGFLMYDSKGNILPSVDSLAPHSTMEEEAAVNVLLLKPRHVKIYKSVHLSADFCKVMELFDCKYTDAM